MNLNDELRRLFAESMEDSVRYAYGLGPKTGQNPGHSTTHSTYSGNITVLPEDPQERWEQHWKRFMRGERLTGDGRVIREERYHEG